jgi:hypothetical protein
MDINMDIGYKYFFLSAPHGLSSSLFTLHGHLQKVLRPSGLYLNRSFDSLKWSISADKIQPFSSAIYFIVY